MPLSAQFATEGACSQDNIMISRLAHLPWFAGLPAELLTHIARHGTELSPADQQVLFLKIFPAQYLALVLSGQVFFSLHNQDGRELIIDRSQVGTGGESALLKVMTGVTAPPWRMAPCGGRCHAPSLAP